MRILCFVKVTQAKEKVFFSFERHLIGNEFNLMKRWGITATVLDSRIYVCGGLSEILIGIS